MATNYQRGRNFEYYVMKRLADKGYFCLRSAGSHTVIDIVAFNNQELLLIQLKASSVESEPNVKQLLHPFTTVADKTVPTDFQFNLTGTNTCQIKSNVKILEELKVPLITGLQQPRYARKLILWKGTGRQNIFQFEWNVNKWLVTTDHILKEK